MQYPQLRVFLIDSGESINMQYLEPPAWSFFGHRQQRQQPGIGTPGYTSRSKTTGVHGHCSVLDSMYGGGQRAAACVPDRTRRALNNEQSRKMSRLRLLTVRTTRRTEAPLLERSVFPLLFHRLDEHWRRKQKERVREGKRPVQCRGRGPIV
jgi:hypothetical protein